MIRRNILANTIGRGWNAISAYVFIPLYLEFLGGEAYGLVGFYATLMGVLAFADLGLTATLNREMARLSVRKDLMRSRADFVRTFESAYGLISLLVVFVIWLLAPLIASHWLQSSTLDSREITSVIRLMGVSIALQLLANLYLGGLMGLQRQVLASFLQMGLGILRGVGAVLALWLIDSTVFVFFSWQLSVNILYCLAARMSLWNIVSHDGERPHLKWSVLRSTWHYAAGIAGVTFISVILGQTDKLAVSKMLSLEFFAYYTLAVALASVPTVLACPIGAAVFPRFAGMVAAGDRNGLALLYRKTSVTVAVSVIPIGGTLATFAGQFLLAWTGNTVAAEQADATASLLIAGGVMQAVLVIPYHLALAYGDVRLNLHVGLVSVIVITPLLMFLIAKAGIVGGGLSCLIMNSCTLPYYIYYVHKRFMPGELRRWCLSGVAYPLFASLPILVLGRLLEPQVTSRTLMLAYIVLVGIVATCAATILVPEARSVLLKQPMRLRAIT